MSDSITRLHQAVLAARAADPSSSRTARLLQSSRAKMAKKLAEEAVEVVLRDAYVDADVGKQLGERQPALPKLTRGAIEAPLAGGAADR